MKHDFIYIFNGTTTLDNTLVKVGTVGDRFIYSHGDIVLEQSNITVNDASNGIISYGKIVSDSDISINATWVTISTSDSIDISGGKYNFSAAKSFAVSSDGFNFTGGYLSVKVTEDYYAMMIGEPGITLGENTYIAKPLNGKVGIFDNKYSVVAEDGIPSSEVELCEYKDLSKAEITGIEDKTYTGQPITQNPVVTVDGTKLVEGTDYTVTYDAGNNISGIKYSHFSKLDLLSSKNLGNFSSI